MARHRAARHQGTPPLSGLTHGGVGTASPTSPDHRRRARPAGHDALVAAAGSGLVALAGSGLLTAVGAEGGPTSPALTTMDAAIIGTVRDVPTSQASSPGTPFSTPVAELPGDRVVGDVLVKEAQLAQGQMLQRLRGDALALARADGERARRPSKPGAPAAATTSGRCDLSTTGLGPVKPWVRAAAEILGCRFGRPTMLGVAGRSSASDHPAGLAVDFMVDRATGDRLARCALTNANALGVKYVIWRQRIDTGDGWVAMEDRGSTTANHMDHVHISFDGSAGTGSAIAC